MTLSVFIYANLLYIFLWWDICLNFSHFFSNNWIACLLYMFWIQVFIRNTFWEYFLPVWSLSFCFEFPLCSVQFSSVTQLCPTLSDPMGCNMSGFPVRPQIPQLTQMHVHWVGGSIQPSHPLSSPSPPTFNLSQHQGLFRWVSSLHQVAKVLEFHLQHQSFPFFLC